MIRIGLEFQAERKRKNLTIEEVAKATKIRQEFLSAIERGDYKKLPSAAYASGFVRNYAKFLGFSVEKSLALFRREFDEKKSVEVLPRGLANPKEYSGRRLRVGRGTILIAVLFFLVGGFLLFQYRSAILNPSLSVDSPRENQSVNSLTIEIKGRTDPDATLMIDDEEVSVNNDGSFDKSLTVFPGSTSINFKAENRFGRVTLLKRDIIVKSGY